MTLLNTTLGRTNLSVSRIGLGTVEIGLPYGIGVKDVPTNTEAEYILKTAIELGISYIDTARGYGLAEERIGKSGIGKNPQVVIGTKTAQFLKQEPTLSGAELEKRIREEIDISRRNLQQESLQLVQLHIELADYTHFTELIEIMQKLVTEQKIQHVGIATRGEAAPLSALSSDFFATVQTAYNILDQRMAQQVFPAAQAHNVGIINRSVLLKGALSTAVDKLPEELTPLKINAKRAAELAAAAGMDLPTMALRFVISNPAISTALIGTITPHHLETAMAAIAAGPLPEDVLQQLYLLAINDPQQVDPANWPTII